MKLFSFSSALMAGAFTIGACCCQGPKSLSNIAMAAEIKSEALVSERDYLIQGMTCSGCEFGVKKALARAGVEKNQIDVVDARSPEPEKKIGHAKIKFAIGQHKGFKTDCRIVKEIRENPGYIAYWDASNTDPCGLNPKK